MTTREVLTMIEEKTTLKLKLKPRPKPLPKLNLPPVVNAESLQPIIDKLFMPDTQEIPSSVIRGSRIDILGAVFTISSIGSMMYALLKLFS